MDKRKPGATNKDRRWQVEWRI